MSIQLSQTTPLFPPAIAPSDRPCNIVLVEDCLGDAMLTRLTLQQIGRPYRMRSIARGEQVLDHLTQCYTNGETVDFMLLDLGMPGMDGFAILDELSHSPAFLRNLTIVITSGYAEFEYIKTLFPDLHIAGYLHKPMTVHGLKLLMGCDRMTA